MVKSSSFRMVSVVRYLVLLGVVSSVESSCGQKGERGYGLTKREYLNKNRREVKDLFERESSRENPSYGLASF